MVKGLIYLSIYLYYKRGGLKIEPFFVIPWRNDVSNEGHIFTPYFSCRVFSACLQKMHNKHGAVILLLHSGQLLRATAGHFSCII